MKIRLCPKRKKPTLKNATNVSGWLAPDMFELNKIRLIKIKNLILIYSY